MAASQEQLQGSLFEENDQQLLCTISPIKSAEASDQKLTNQQLKDDASLRPRFKKTNQNNIDYEISELDKFIDEKSDQPKWSHHSLPKIDDLTPALRHYAKLKSSDPERVLLYRLGDFFECFFEDAITLSKLLEITLTSKEGGKKIGRVPMAGIPHHAADRYCTELIKKGLSIAICDQLEAAPSKGNKLIKRGITRLITPGTILEEGMLEARKNNWLATVLIDKSSPENLINWSLAKVDVSTGEFNVQEGEGIDNLRQELIKLNAAEIISEKDSISNQNWHPISTRITEFNQTSFTSFEAEVSIKNHYNLTHINALGIHSYPLSLRAIGGLIAYLNKTHPALDNESYKKTHIALNYPQLKLKKSSLIIDTKTRRNLEITSTQRDGQFYGSLLWAIDKTLTAMGGRCIRRWLEEPLIKKDSIQFRQEIIGLLIKSSPLRKNLRKILRTMGDLERLAGRAGAQQASGRDLIAIAEGISRLPLLSQYLNDSIFKQSKYF